MKNKIIKTVSIYTSIFLISTIGLAGSVYGNKFKNESEKPKPNYKTNKNGDTYGSLADSISEDTEPDLILVEMENGELGYVKKNDLKEKKPKNPEEAIQIQKEKDKKIKEQKNKGEKPGKYIKVYDINGEKIKGEFFIDDVSSTIDESN